MVGKTGFSLVDIFSTFPQILLTAVFTAYLPQITFPYIDLIKIYKIRSIKQVSVWFYCVDTTWHYFYHKLTTNYLTNLNLKINTTTSKGKAYLNCDQELKKSFLVSKQILLSSFAWLFFARQINSFNSLIWAVCYLD